MIAMVDGPEEIAQNVVLTPAQKNAVTLMLAYEKRLMNESRWVDYPHAIIAGGPTTTDGGQPFIHFLTARRLEDKGLVRCIWDQENSGCELTQAGRYVAYDIERKAS